LARSIGAVVGVEGRLSSHEAVGRIRGLAEAMVVLEDAMRRAVGAARDEEVSVADMASALGVHRATVYRRYLSPATGELKAELDSDTKDEHHAGVRAGGPTTRISEWSRGG